EPPLPKVKDLVQSGVRVGQLTLVDDEAGLIFSLQDSRNDLIEGNDFSLDLRREQLQGKKRGGQGPWHGDLLGLNVVRRQRARSHDHGTVLLAHAAATGQQRVLVLEIGIRVKADGCDVVESIAFNGLPVQRLDVCEGVSETQAGDADLVGRQ